MVKSYSNDDEIAMAHKGLSAFESGDHWGAIVYFTELSKRDPELWEYRLYLGMAHCQVSQLGSALQEFKDIVSMCPDEAIKERALVALKAMHKQSHQKLKTLKSLKSS